MQPLARTKLTERYELKELLGRGGMGLVYKARDLVMNRDVALKTLLDIDNETTLDLFFKECGVLAAMVHPNIVSIYDIGEFDQDGTAKPFFTMPLLPGATLDALIQDGRKRCNAAAVVDIISQSCRGLHAAHEMKLVHRDIKPSNIFVLDDDSVKLIDFGIARSASAASRTVLKGTLYYMSPEQIHMKAPSALSDQYALAVVCYEAMTGQRPFQGSTDREIAEAILFKTPVPVSALNPEVSRKVSQVIHRAFARDPLHRFPDVREFGSALQRSFRNEPLPYFEIGKIRPRLDRAASSFASGDAVFASELLSEIEAEGYLDDEITALRSRIDQQMQRSRLVQSLNSAKSSLEAGEYVLALRKVNEALEHDPEDSEALALRDRIEKLRQERKVDEALQVAHRHLDRNSFREAREAIEEVLAYKPTETHALMLLTQLSRQEQDLARVREKKTELFKVAQQYWERGNLTGSLSKLESLLDLEKQFPEPDPQQNEIYRKLYETVNAARTELKNSYDEALALYRSGELDRALTLCTQTLELHPGHAPLQALKIDIEQERRQKIAGLIAALQDRLDNEPDLDERVTSIEQAIAQYPDEPFLKNLLLPAREKRDLVRSILDRATAHEQNGEWDEALDQWKTLEAIHPRQNGLAATVSRLRSLAAEEQQNSVKTELMGEVHRSLTAFDYETAQRHLSNLTGRFPSETDVEQFRQSVAERIENGQQARSLLAQASKKVEETRTSDALPILRRAATLDSTNPFIQTVLVNSLVQSARESASANPSAASELLQEALRLDPANQPARKLGAELSERGQRDFVAWCSAQARELEAQGDFEGALVIASKGLESHPDDPELRDLQMELLRHRSGAAPSRSAGAASPAPERKAEKKEASISLLTPPPPAPQPPPSRESSVAPPPESHPTPARTPKGNWIAVGAAAVAVVLVGIAALVPRKAAEQPPPPALPSNLQTVRFTVTPPGAALQVDGKPCGNGTCELRLYPGAHRVSASMAGYSPAEKSIELRPGASPAPFQLALDAIVPAASFASNLADGHFTLDGAPLQGPAGQPLEQAIKPGEHQLQFVSKNAKTGIGFRVVPGAIPEVDVPAARRELATTIGAGLGPDGKITSTLATADFQVDGKPAGKLVNGTGSLTGLTLGSHEIIVSGGGLSQRLLLHSGPSPAISFFVGGSFPLGTLIVESNQDDIRLFIDEFKMRQTTHQGKLTARLPERTYTIRGEKDGFPPIQFTGVTLKKEAETKLSFNFVAQTTGGSLNVHGAPPGALVSLDGKRLGQVRADGGFSASGIEPGRKTVTVSQTHYKSQQTALDFANGKTADLAAPLAPASGTVNLEITPANLQPVITIRHGDEAAQTVRGTQLSLLEGPYLISGRAPGYDVATASVTVVPEKEVAVQLNFHPTAAPRPVSQGYSLSSWQRVPGWREEGRALVRDGGGYVASPFSGGTGVYSFTALLPKGKRVDWVVNFADAKNCVLFELSGSSLSYTQLVDGAKKMKNKIPVKLAVDQNVGLTINVTDSFIAVTVDQADQKLTNLARVSDPEGHFTKGRFAFHVPGKDTLTLQDFRYNP